MTLSVGEHVRLPRTYRGRDVLWWMDRAGVVDERYDEVDDLTRARRLPSPQLVGTPERSTLDLNTLADLGVQLFGGGRRCEMARRCSRGGLRNAFSLADLKLERLLDSFDTWVRATAPQPSSRRRCAALPPGFPPPPGGAARPAQRRNPHDRMGDRADLRLALMPWSTRRAPPPRRRHGRQPWDVRPRTARPATAQIYVHVWHRGRRAEVVDHLAGHLARLIRLEPPAAFGFAESRPWSANAVLRRPLLEPTAVGKRSLRRPTSARKADPGRKTRPPATLPTAVAELGRLLPW